MPEHTSEPWKVRERNGAPAVCHSENEFFDIASVKGFNGPEARANARRIVLCVNALANVPAAELEALAPGALQGVFDEWRRERGE